jgi:hypothetical protein
VKAKMSRLGVTKGHVSVEDDFASGSGGGIKNDGTLRLEHVDVSKNSVGATGFILAEALGGGIANGGTLTLDHSTVRSNSATANTQDFGGDARAAGAGVYSEGSLVVRKSSINGNHLPQSSNLPAPAEGSGAGVLMSPGSSGTIDSTTVSGNSIEGFGNTGGIELDPNATLMLTNSTIANNHAYFGGGLDNQQGNMTVRATTIAGNSSDAGGANLTNASGGTLDMADTIVGDHSGTAPACSIFPTFTDSGYNLAADDSCSLSAVGDKQNVDPKLGALAKNGGPTKTMALPKSSPAVDHGKNLTHAKTDQRGKKRVVDFGAIGNGAGDGSDIGAFELQKP